jgi:RHS repeat-associated protein
VTAATTNAAFTAFNAAEVNPYRFSSEYADGALGLVYYNYRHYNIWNGKWCSRDYVLLGSGGMYAFLNNRFSSTDRLGLYDELVHFYFIYGYLREHGWKPNDALEAAYGAEYPDTGKWSAMPDGMTINIITFGFFGIKTSEWKLNNATFHNFNGLSKDGIEKYRECIRTKISKLHSCKCPFSIGLLLHALGDTYAHVQVSGDAYDNCNRFGHTRDSFLPDDVQSMSVILDDTYDPFDYYRYPAIERFIPSGEIQFMGFVNDLKSLQLDSSYNHETSYSQTSLMGDLYARSEWWQQLYRGDYKYSAKDKLRKYGLQFEKLDFLKEKTVDEHISSLPDRSCRDIEASRVREMLRTCLDTAGWKGIQ